jgi:tetratricopeptide (TPR) repeat protein
MSLIDGMLKDLENRRSQGGDLNLVAGMRVIGGEHPKVLLPVNNNQVRGRARWEDLDDMPFWAQKIPQDLNEVPKISAELKEQFASLFSAKAEVNPKVKPEVKPEVKSEVKAESKAKASTKTEPKAKTKVKSAAKTHVKTSVKEKIKDSLNQDIGLEPKKKVLEPEVGALFQGEDSNFEFKKFLLGVGLGLVAVNASYLFNQDESTGFISEVNLASWVDNIFDLDKIKLNKEETPLLIAAKSSQKDSPVFAPAAKLELTLEKDDSELVDPQTKILEAQVLEAQAKILEAQNKAEALAAQAKVHAQLLEVQSKALEAKAKTQILEAQALETQAQIQAQAQALDNSLKIPAQDLESNIAIDSFDSLSDIAKGHSLAEIAKLAAQEAHQLQETGWQPPVAKKKLKTKASKVIKTKKQASLEDHDPLQESYWQASLEPIESLEESEVIRSQPTTGNMRKQFRRESRDGTKMLAHAQALAERGQTSQAVRVLENALEHSPQTQIIREKLAQLYIQNDNYQEAKNLLAEGLAQNSDHFPYVKLMARALIALEQTEEALILLTKRVPAISEDPEYHSILGALHQRVGEHEQAMQIYWHLLDHFPEGGRWWTGLAISMEATGESVGALDGYRRAIRDYALSPSLRSFVGERIKLLSMAR